MCLFAIVVLAMQLFDSVEVFDIVVLTKIFLMVLHTNDTCHSELVKIQIKCTAI